MEARRFTFIVEEMVTLLTLVIRNMTILLVTFYNGKTYKSTILLFMHIMLMVRIKEIKHLRISTQQQYQILSDLFKNNKPSNQFQLI